VADVRVRSPALANLGRLVGGPAERVAARHVLPENSSVFR